MLVLNRNWGDRILIGDDIEIVVSAPVGSRGARIGISAPDHVRILRKEIEHKYKKGDDDVDGRD
jgi:carbon storage regulator CsrA